jgi:uncharacterized membrane protein YdbT with pleckstrin-like domain
MSVQTFEDEQILEESGPKFSTSIGHIGIIWSSISFLILPLLYSIRSQYVITNERVVVKNKAIRSSSREIRIEDIRQLNTYSGLIFRGGIEVTVGAGSTIKIPFRNANDAANTIRRLTRDASD